MTTVQEIESTYSEKAVGILRGWYEARDVIAAGEESVAGPHSDLLTDAQRAQAVREQKSERARAKAEGFRREYAELIQERNDAVRERVRLLHEGIYAVEDADTLSRAALATDAQLGAMMELAATAGNEDLARAVFVVAEQRRLGEIMAAYFDRVHPEARPLYGELRSAPSEEGMERRLSDAERLFAPPTAQDFAAPSFGAA